MDWEALMPPEQWEMPRLMTNLPKSRGIRSKTPLSLPQEYARNRPDQSEICMIQFCGSSLLPQIRDGQFSTCVTAKLLANFLCENLVLAGVYLKCLYSWEFKSKWEPERKAVNGFLNGFDKVWKSFCFWSNRGGAESLPAYFWLGCEKAVNARVVQFHKSILSGTGEAFPFNGCDYRYESLKVPGFYLGTTDPSFQESFCHGEEGEERAGDQEAVKGASTVWRKQLRQFRGGPEGGAPDTRGRLA